MNVLSFETWFWNFVANTLLMCLQLLVLFFYFSIKAKRLVNFIDTFLGLGDILLMIVFAGAFSMMNFIMFYLVSLLISIPGFLLYKKICSSGSREVPFAAFLCLVYGVLLSYSMFIKDVSFFSDLIFVCSIV